MRASTADIRSTLALLAAITLFAAAFLILNTLAMTVVERIRELGLLRAAGAARAQLVRVVLVQALVLGAAGSLGGVVARGRCCRDRRGRWLRAAGSWRSTGRRSRRRVLAAGLAGIVVTLVAALEPARRAAGVSPVAALRVRGDPGASVRSHTSWLVAVVAVGRRPRDRAAARRGHRAGGRSGPSPCMASCCSPCSSRRCCSGPLGRVVGLPFGAVLRLEERLARAAIARDRGRTTLTVGSLVVGLAMLVALGSVAANARVTATAWLDEVVPATRS